MVPSGDQEKLLTPSDDPSAFFEAYPVGVRGLES